jgi:hypothetical protein
MGQDTGRRDPSRPRTGLIVDRRLHASAPHPAGGSTREGRAGAAIAAPHESTARIERAAAGLRIGDDGLIHVPDAPVVGIPHAGRVLRIVGCGVVVVEMDEVAVRRFERFHLDPDGR